MILTWEIICAGLGMLALFFGYAMGRRMGKREGFLEGCAYAPLDLRRKSWERGACLVCGRLAGDSPTVAHEEAESIQTEPEKG